MWTLERVLDCFEEVFNYTHTLTRFKRAHSAWNWVQIGCRDQNLDQRRKSTTSHRLNALQVDFLKLSLSRFHFLNYLFVSMGTSFTLLSAMSLLYTKSRDFVKRHKWCLCLLRINVQKLLVTLTGLVCCQIMGADRLFTNISYSQMMEIING